MSGPCSPEGVPGWIESMSSVGPSHSYFPSPGAAMTFGIAWAMS